MIEVEFKLFDKELQKLVHADKALTFRVDNALKDAGFLIKNTMKRGIQRGPKTGRLYKRGRKLHQASAPGEYPATDTGRLVASIRSNHSHLMEEIGSHVKYAGFVDIRTKHKAPRPWLEPSLKENEQAIEQLINHAINRAFT